MDLMRQVRSAAEAAGQPNSRERRLESQRRAALLRYEAQLRHHRSRIAGWKAGALAAAGGTVAFGLTATQASNAVELAAVGGLAAGSAAVGLRSRRRARELAAHPPVPQIPPPPPARLRPSAQGAGQVDRVAQVLMNLYDLVPAVGRLYPAAGQELWRTVSEVEPLLRGQVERLDSLDRLRTEMPGSRAAEAAASAATEIVGRVRAGADALEDLLAAAASLLAAPDIGDAVPDTLAPAILSLQAYAYGLGAANAAGLPRA